MVIIGCSRHASSVHPQTPLSTGIKTSPWKISMSPDGQPPADPHSHSPLIWSVWHLFFVEFYQKIMVQDAHSPTHPQTSRCTLEAPLIKPPIKRVGSADQKSQEWSGVSQRNFVSCISKALGAFVPIFIEKYPTKGFFTAEVPVFFPLHERYPTVVHLAAHLDDERWLYFRS